MGDNQESEITSRYTYENWKEPAFNPATNFSLLGYIISLFCRRNKDKSVVDFIIDKK